MSVLLVTMELEAPVMMKGTLFSIAGTCDAAVTGLEKPPIRRSAMFSRIRRLTAVTPSCGLAGLPIEAAERALELLADLSRDLKKRYLKD